VKAEVADEKAAVADVTKALASASLKGDVAAAASAPAVSGPAPLDAAVTPVGATAAVTPVVPSSLDEPVKGADGELLNGGFKRGGAENGADGVYDEVELEDMEWDEDMEEYWYPCPCGDSFRIAKEEMLDGEDIARCPSCSLLLRVIFDPEDLEEDED